MTTDDILLDSMPDDPSGGKRLGPCVLWTRIGAGGRGTVYVGDHDRLGKDMAIKVLPVTLRLNDPDYDDRFYQEARAAQSVKDRRIVRVYEVGEASPHLYMAMEFISGGTLRKRMQAAGGKLPVRDALRIMQEFAGGLESAHSAGILHRDIKPDNIMFNDYDEIKIADFGLAKIMGSGNTMSQSMAGVGTPRYMAPEQCEDKRIDARADIYSMGVVMYECLAGAPPFDGETPSEIMFKVQRGGYKKLKDLSIGVPPAVSDFVDSLMAMDPGKRPASARDVADSLGEIIRALDSQPASAPIERVRRPGGSSGPQTPAAVKERTPSTPAQIPDLAPSARRISERTPDNAPVKTPAPSAPSRTKTGSTPFDRQRETGVRSVKDYINADAPVDDDMRRKSRIVMWAIIGILGLMTFIACLGAVFK